MAIRKIVSRSIGTDVIAAEDLANNSVTVAEITDGAVTSAKMNGLTSSSSGIIQADGDGSLSTTTVNTELVNDTTPQLGGDLDVNSNEINGDGIINLTGGSSNHFLQASGPRGLIIGEDESSSTRSSRIFLENSTAGEGFSVFNENGTSLKISSGATAGTSSGAVKFQLTDDGSLLAPHTPSFYANSSPSKNASNYLYSFGNVRHNVGSHYNNSTGIFTCPYDGYYFISAGIRVNDYAQLFAVINSSDDIGAEADASGGTGDSANLAAVYYCDANDTIRLQLTSGSMVGSTPRMHFCVRLLG
jgi:hypothetical protein